TGQPFTSKDFRTWGGTVLAACALAESHRNGATKPTKRQIVDAVKAVSNKLGNTVAVCRKSYIHPAVLDAYIQGSVIRARTDVPVGAIGTTHTLSDEEKAVVGLLRRRMALAS